MAQGLRFNFLLYFTSFPIDLTEFHGFKYNLYVGDSYIFISSPNLSIPESPFQWLIKHLQLESSKYCKLKLSRIEFLLFVYKTWPPGPFRFPQLSYWLSFQLSPNLEVFLAPSFSYPTHPVHQQILLTLISKILLAKQVLITPVTSLAQAFISTLADWCGLLPNVPDSPFLPISIHNTAIRDIP